MFSCHAGSVQRAAWHVVLAVRGANRKAAADGMRAIIDESGGAVGWRATASASWPQQWEAMSGLSGCGLKGPEGYLDRPSGGGTRNLILKLKYPGRQNNLMFA